MPGRSRGGNAAGNFHPRPGPASRLPRTGRGHRGGPDDRARPPAGRWEGAIHSTLRGADLAPRFPTAPTARPENAGVATEKLELSAPLTSHQPSGHCHPISAQPKPPRGKAQKHQEADDVGHHGREDRRGNGRVGADRSSSSGIRMPASAAASMLMTIAAAMTQAEIGIVEPGAGDRRR